MMRNPLRFTLTDLQWWNIAFLFKIIAISITVQLLLPMTQIFIPTASNNRPASLLAEILVNDPSQQHPRLVENAILMRVAQGRARDMADRGYFAHADLNGYGPNYHARQAGYTLPEYYSKAADGNSIESIGAGFEQPIQAWEAWMESPAHKRHLLGEIDFFRDQDEYGVGYAYNPDSQYRYYWVVIIARREENSGE
jgi:hypothetical protein